MHYLTPARVKAVNRMGELVNDKLPALQAAADAIIAGKLKVLKADGTITKQVLGLLPTLRDGLGDRAWYSVSGGYSLKACFMAEGRTNDGKSDTVEHSVYLVSLTDGIATSGYHDRERMREDWTVKEVEAAWERIRFLEGQVNAIKSSLHLFKL